VISEPSVCQSVTWAGCAKTAERIDVVIGVETHGDRRNIVLDGGCPHPGLGGGGSMRPVAKLLWLLVESLFGHPKWRLMSRCWLLLLMCLHTCQSRLAYVNCTLLYLAIGPLNLTDQKVLDGLGLNFDFFRPRFSDRPCFSSGDSCPQISCSYMLHQFWEKVCPIFPSSDGDTRNICLIALYCQILLKIGRCIGYLPWVPERFHVSELEVENEP